MAYIRHIPPTRAAGRLAQVYAEVRQDFPRVPSLIQLFSLRPDLMEAVYRSWLAVMWSGRVARRTKEMLAVVVSKAAKCDYCVDAHTVFLIACGTDAGAAYQLESELYEASWLSGREQVAAQLAARITADPRAIGAADIAAFADAWPHAEDRSEIISLVAAFGTITRIANALGLSPEIPAPLRRFETARRTAISLLARLTAISVDLAEKPLRAHTPEENHAAMLRLFRSQLGFPEVPPGFRLLERCPETFDSQLRSIEKTLCVLPRDRWMRIGLVVAKLTGCAYFAENCGRWLAQRGVDASGVIAASEGAGSMLSEVEESCLRFARDLTLHAHTVGEDRIRELRRLGLSDGAILDLAYVAGVFNAMVRLVRVLTPLEERAAA